MLSASIAQVPIATDLSHLPAPRRVEFAETAQIRPELNLTDRLPRQNTIKSEPAQVATAPEQKSAPITVAPPPQEPPLPPGAMFAAAVIAGQLSPKPESMEEVFLRVGVSWTPPDSDYRLADRLI